MQTRFSIWKPINVIYYNEAKRATIMLTIQKRIFKIEIHLWFNKQNLQQTQLEGKFPTTSKVIWWTGSFWKYIKFTQYGKK